MPSLADFAARGKVIRVYDDSVVFQPNDTNYELYLVTSGRYDGPVNVPVSASWSAKYSSSPTSRSNAITNAIRRSPPRTLRARS